MRNQISGNKKTAELDRVRIGQDLDRINGIRRKLQRHQTSRRIDERAGSELYARLVGASSFDADAIWRLNDAREQPQCGLYAATRRELFAFFAGDGVRDSQSFATV